MHLSVIIPTLRRPATAALIAERVAGLLPGLEVEAIVVLPASLPLPADHGPVRHVADPGRGVYPAYRAGLRAARGEYVWFIGDDDYPLDAAAALAGPLQEAAADLVVAPVLFSSGRLYRPTRSLLVLHFLNWCQQGVVYRREALRRHPLHSRLRVQADQFTNLRLRAEPGIAIRYLDAPICVFGVGGVSGRLVDEAYRQLRVPLARRTLGPARFLEFRALCIIQPLVKRLVRLR